MTTRDALHLLIGSGMTVCAVGIFKQVRRIAEASESMADTLFWQDAEVTDVTDEYISDTDGDELPEIGLLTLDEELAWVDIVNHETRTTPVRRLIGWLRREG